KARLKNKQSYQVIAYEIIKLIIYDYIRFNYPTEIQIFIPTNIFIKNTNIISNFIGPNYF
ncbi:hypothetical protein, partial [Lactobacillus helveticus]|uniref:hypothetical protein n=1 Tax=Lactobacillus helveticus TaxID=1587 RepID=UPI001E48BB26